MKGEGPIDKISLKFNLPLQIKKYLDSSVLEMTRY